MNTIIKCLVGCIALTSVVELTGCATAGKNALPQGGDMTMSQIYQQETGLGGGSYYPSNNTELNRARQKVLPRAINYTGYTANSVNQINHLFKRMPNPEVDLYVYPHLVNENGESQPVPGYTTAFFMYKSNHFALPSEQY